MSLFKLEDADEERPMRRIERLFDFFKRSKLPAIQRIKSVINDWLDRVPVFYRDELTKRMKRNDFEAAFFELVLHELFLRLGWQIDIHPNVGTRGKRPDFLVQLPDGRRAVVEACTLLGDTLDDENAQHEAVLDGIDQRLKRGDFYLGFVELHVARGHSAPIGRICEFLDQKLETLDNERVKANFRQDKIETIVYQDERCVMTFYAIPKVEGAKAHSDDRIIVAESTGCRWGTRVRYLRTVLSRKARWYGELGLPYLIAVNDNLPWGVEDHEIREFLCGEKQEYVNAMGQHGVRQLDHGFWGQRTVPSNTSVSAIALFSVRPWIISRAQTLLYAHHSPKWPFPQDAWPFARYDSETFLVSAANSTFAEVFGLPTDWPGPLFADNE